MSNQDMPPADIKGTFGRAWKVDFNKAIETLGKTPEDHACIASWIVEAPWAHPTWHSYALILVHLRPLKDNRPTIMYLPGATHELWLYALDPDGDRAEYVKTGLADSCKFLEPKNFSAQFIEPDDVAACLRFEETIKDIVAGTLSPDTDFRSQWVARFGDNMMRK